MCRSEDTGTRFVAVATLPNRLAAANDRKIGMDLSNSHACGDATEDINHWDGKPRFGDSVSV